MNEKPITNEEMDKEQVEQMIKSLPTSKQKQLLNILSEGEKTCCTKPTLQKRKQERRRKNKNRRLQNRKHK